MLNQVLIHTLTCHMISDNAKVIMQEEEEDFTNESLTSFWLRLRLLGVHIERGKDASPRAHTHTLTHIRTHAHTCVRCRSHLPATSEFATKARGTTCGRAADT